MRWHPDRCSALGKSEFIKEAKEKFQAIQEAYSILSDSNKRFLYDVGVYDSDDDENEMGDFLDEMVQMMSQTKPTGNCQDSFEDLQQLFVDMFQSDLDLRGLGVGHAPATNNFSSSSNVCFNPSEADYGGGGGKRRGSTLSSATGKAKLEELDAGCAGFCFGSNESMQPVSGRGGSRRNGRKQKMPSKQGISSKDTGISA